MTNVEIALVFDQVADLLEFQNVNPFRVRAYRNAARVVRDLPESVVSIIDDPRRALTDIDGIGKDLADKITTLVETQELPLLAELQAEIPQSVLALLRIPGLGPKKAAALHRELGIVNLDQVREACVAHRVRELKGFGAKTEDLILLGIPFAEQAGQRIYWAEADVLVRAIYRHLARAAGVKRLEAAGSYRRGRETVGDLDFLVVSDQPDAVMDRLAEFAPSAMLVGRGDTKMSLRLPQGLQIDLRVVPEESFGAALQYFTGSKDHNILLRGRAKDLGLKINEYGVYRDDKPVAGRTEEEVYAALGLPWIPPELREARREFEWAESGTLPRLIELDQIRGDLHMHTSETDGQATLRQMRDAAAARRLEYIAITDHSPRVTMANGLNPRRLRAQWAEIDCLNQEGAPVQVLKGIEVDILEKGGLDLPDDVLAEADWVVASVHYGQNQPPAQITERILGAIAHPHVSAIAHPTGRLINRRKPYEVDLEAVIRAAREQGKFLELNANPARLDLDDLACAAAKHHGVPIVISTDAHSTEGLDVLRYGVMQARRAGLTTHDVVNTRPWAQVKRMIGRTSIPQA